MGLETLVVITIAILLGAVLGHIFKKKIKRFLNKKQKEMDKIINDPDLLVEKLNNNGQMVDSGEELKYSVVEEDGVRKVSLTKTKVKPESSPRPQAGKKKVSKKKKIPIKKKVVKKSGSKKG